MRLTGLAAIYGLIAGAAAALTLALMTVVNHAVWSVSDSRWYIFAAILSGGLLIALTRTRHEGMTLAAQLDAAHDPMALKKGQTLMLALSAIAAVGFGGAVGPEAGLLAVVAELSALVALAVGRNQAEQRLIGEAGAAAALSGFYGSPPGAAVFANERAEPPKALLLLAAVTGLAGFLFTGWLVLPGGFGRLELPAYTPAGNGIDVLLAFIPAGLGAGMGLLFLLLLPKLEAIVQRLAGGVFVQTMIGSACFALLAAMLPVLRFSGHHEIEAMLRWAAGAGWLALFLLGALKILATALCLASGWRGGVIFPLIFAGAAAGAASVGLVPGMEPTVALAAGMGAAATIGLGKPVAALLIMLFLVGPGAFGPLCVGALVGYACSRFVPNAQLH